MDIYNDASNLNTIKYRNKSLILRVINSLGQVSRAELSRITGLTKTSITNITGELIDEGVIYETGTMESQSGRKPTMLNLCENARYALGIYISRDYAHVNIVNLRGKVISESRCWFEQVESKQTFMDNLYRQIYTVMDCVKTDASRILGLGIASIGPLDIREGIILDPPNFRGLSSIPIVRDLKEKLGFECYLDNDMNASAIAEKLLGSAKDIPDFIYIGVTNGIGAGIIINNNIFKGSSGFAGEIGHTTIDIHGERCGCGNFGCLELYTTIPNIVEQVRSSIALGAGSCLSPKEEINWEKIVFSAKHGDQLCIKAIDRMVYYLSAGIVNLANSFDPEIIFLGHDISIAWELIIQPLNEMVNKSIMARNLKRLEIRLSQFKEYAPCMGAPSLVLNRFFNGGVF